MTDDRWLFAWALGSVALGGASLLVPLYVVSLGGDAVALGALAAVAALAAVPGALVVGRLADRTERRRGYVVAALVAVGATLLALPFVDSVAVVVAANGVVWLAAAAAAPVLTLLVTVGAPEREWPTRFGVLNTYQGWGWVGGLAGGLAWTTTGAQTGSPLLTRRTFFLACGIAALVAAALAVRWLPPEPGRERSPRRIARALARTRRFNVRGATFPFWPSRTYWSLRTVDPRRLAGRLSTALGLTYVAVALAFTGFAAFFAPLPLFLTDAAGFDSGTVFGLYLASSLGSALLYVGAGRLASRADPSLVLVGGLSARAVLFPAVALLAGAGAAVGTGATLGLAALVFAGVGATWAVITVVVTTVLTGLAPDGSKGEVLGVYGALAGLAGTVGSVLGGVVAGWGYLAAFGTAGGLVACGVVVLLVGRRLAGPTPVSAAGNELATGSERSADQSTGDGTD